VAAGSTLDFNSGYTLTGANNVTGMGSVIISKGFVRTVGTLTAASISIHAGAALSGPGTLQADVVNAGEIDVGGFLQAGTLNVTGNYTQTATGRLEIELAGRDAGTQYDNFIVFGAVQLDGTLDVRLRNGFVPNAGDRFTIMVFPSRMGDFARKTGLKPGHNIVLDPVYNANTLTLVAVAP
jgi:hypothetical protein